MNRGPQTGAARMPRREFIGVGTLALLAACARPAAKDARGTLRISQRSEPGTLDPSRATLPDEYFVLRALLEGLVTPNPNGGEPRPGAARRWEISPDGLTYAFFLRPDGRWSDGEPVVAGDFLFTFQRLLTPTTAAPKVSLFFDVAGAEAFYRGQLTDFAATGFSAPSDRTLVVRLARPNPSFLAYVASGPWLPVPPHAVRRHGDAWARAGNLVGNGPFTLASWDPQQRIRVIRRADFAGADQIELDAIDFVAFDNGDAEERAFRAGQIDITLSVPPHRLPTYAAEQPKRLRQVALHETRYLTFNTTRGPLADVRVRQALSRALDRTTLVEKVLQGGQRPTESYVPPDLGGYLPPAFSPSADPASARRLLAEAGFPEGRGFPRLVLSTWTNVPVLEVIQARWKAELGIEVELLQREARVHLAALSAGDYDIGFMTAIPDVADPADLLAEFTRGHPANYPRWEKPEFDAMISLEAREPGTAARLAALADAERLMLAEQPVAPLYFNTRSFLVDPAVQGWREDGLWTRFYDGVRVSRAS